MTQRVRDGLGLPPGLYRLGEGANPTFYIPNGITADRVDSLVYANVVPVSGGYDLVVYDSDSGVFVLSGNPNPSPTHFNNEAVAFADDMLRLIFNAAQEEVDFPYSLVPSETRANIVDDLATLKADFILNPPE